MYIYTLYVHYIYIYIYIYICVCVCVCVCKYICTNWCKIYSCFKKSLSDMISKFFKIIFNHAKSFHRKSFFTHALKLSLNQVC